MNDSFFIPNKSGNGDSDSPVGSMHNNSRLRWLLAGCGVLLTFFLVVGYLVAPSLVQSFIFKSTDIVLSNTKVKQQPRTDIVTVRIDDRSLEQYGQWPWPRSLMGRLLTQINNSGAAVIGIDVIFSEKDNRQPISLEKRRGQSVVDNDAYLAGILESGPFVLGHEFYFTENGLSTEACTLNPVLFSAGDKAKLAVAGPSFYSAVGVVCNYKALAESAPASGFLNGSPDLDGILRRIPLLIEYEGEYYPSFVLAVLLQLYPEKIIGLDRDGAGFLHITRGGVRIPIDEQGDYLLGPKLSGAGKDYSAVDVLEGRITAEQLKGKIVLVGTTGAGLSHFFTTPSATYYSSLDVQRGFLEALLSDRHTLRTFSFAVYEAAVTILLSLIIILCMLFLPVSLAACICVVIAGGSWFVVGWVYNSSGLLFSPLLPSLAALLNGGLLVTLRYRHDHGRANRERDSSLFLLTKSEKELKSILDTVPDIIFRLDTNGKLIFLSPAIAAYAINPDILLGHSIFELVVPEDLDKAQYRLNERRTGARATLDMEIRLLLMTPDDEEQEQWRYFSVSASGIYEDGVTAPKGFLGTQGIVRDITERKRLELQLIEAQKMEVVGNLASGVAHDLNNILGGLVSYPDLLLMEIAKDDPMYKKIELIQRSGKRAAAIVQDLLTLARRNVKVSEVICMNDIILEYLGSADFKQVQAVHPNVHLSTDLQVELMHFSGSSVHLSKVVMNILHNGLEAMPDGGTMRISTKNTYVDSHYEGYERIPEGEYTCTLFTDTGTGIAATDIKRIFEPFYSKKLMAMSGTGLGMTVIWATIKDHNGFLDIRSEDGKGTSIELYLPTTREQPARQQKKIALDDYHGTETILIVDDVAEQLDIAGNMLEKLGYRVLKASCGEKGLEVFGEHFIDLVILDMIMPGGMDGLSTYQRITELRPQQKAIVVSGFAKSSRVRKIKELGVGSYLQKPYTMEKMAVAVRLELDRVEG